VIDLYSRRLLAAATSLRCDAELCEQAIKIAAGLTRDQVSGCLARLRSSDIDIDRTRPGLYQYRRTTPQVDYGRPAVPVPATEPTPIPYDVPRQLSDPAPAPRATRLLEIRAVRPGQPVSAADLDSLRYLDQGVFGRPVPNVNGRGNSHTLRRQARLAGRAYADRWIDCVNDQAREIVIAHADPRAPAQAAPGRLDDDLLAFADRHRLDVSEPTGLAGQVRIGFWSRFIEHHADQQAAASSRQQNSAGSAAAVGPVC
jgi:hypothetical protein